jgi:endonuclease YncB( thermonuclease family)
VHGTKSDAEAIRTEIGQMLARTLRMTLSEEKTHITQEKYGRYLADIFIDSANVSEVLLEEGLATRLLPPR